MCQGEHLCGRFASCGILRLKFYVRAIEMKIKRHQNYGLACEERFGIHMVKHACKF